LPLDHDSMPISVTGAENWLIRLDL
jgi:hypothetical protein